jgi:hypothetical protein
MIRSKTTYPGVEFICGSITNENEIQAFIRFGNNKSQSAVEKIFNNQVIVTPVAYGNNVYKNELLNGTMYFVYDSKNPQHYNNDTEHMKIMASAIFKLVDNQNVMTSQVIANQNILTQQLVEAYKSVNANLNNTNNTNNTTTNTNTNSHNTNTTNNTTNKNKINLQFFLNERCKDAMNMGEFARTVPINLDDILYFKNHSHCEGITRIIENGLNQLDITQRPIHCTDPKRETLHIKEEGKWINDQKKEVIGKAIQTVVSRSFNGMSLWKTANPEYNYDNEMKTEYAILMKKLLGGNNEEENKEKIIRNMCRISHLDRGNVVSPYNPLPII